MPRINVTKGVKFLARLPRNFAALLCEPLQLSDSSCLDLQTTRVESTSLLRPDCLNDNKGRRT
jgi:hypothetical protein